jgi:hypothetical protein
MAIAADRVITVLSASRNHQAYESFHLELPEFIFQSVKICDVSGGIFRLILH